MPGTRANKMGFFVLGVKIVYTQEVLDLIKNDDQPTKKSYISQGISPVSQNNINKLSN